MASVVIRIGASRSRAPRTTSARPNASPSCASRCWKWLISMIPLRAAMPEHGEEADQRAERQHAVAEHAASTPPTSADGSVRNDRTREPRAAERR